MNMNYCNAEAETAILSAILNNQEQYLNQVTDDDITVPSYKEILKISRELVENGDTPDLVTVCMSIKGKPGLSKIVRDVASQYLAGINYDACVRSIKTSTVKRKIQAGEKFISEQLNLDDPAEIKSNVLDFFSAVPLPGQEQNDSMGSVMDRTYEQLKYKYDHKDDTSNYTGLPDLDEITGGLHPSEMTILAARPSVGKTAMGMQIALNYAKKGNPVQCFSREMSQVQIGTRLIAGEGEIDGQRMRTGRIREEDWKKIKSTMKNLSNLPMYVNDEAATMPDIRAICSQRKRSGLDLVVIDYLQLLDPAKRSDNREREVAEISRAIKKMTLELDIPVIVLSQLNRSASNKRPTLDTLRESGSLEQDADNVVMLHKPDLADAEDKDLFRDLENAGKQYVEVIVGKQRNGPTGMFTMQYNPRFLRFESQSERSDCPF